MQVWPVQDAKAQFSEFLDACMAEGPQMVTWRGAAALVPVSEWRRLQAAQRQNPVQQALHVATGAGCRAELLAPVSIWQVRLDCVSLAAPT